jgi:hypothetical protein
VRQILNPLSRPDWSIELRPRVSRSTSAARSYNTLTLYEPRYGLFAHWISFALSNLDADCLPTVLLAIDSSVHQISLPTYSKKDKPSGNSPSYRDFPHSIRDRHVTKEPYHKHDIISQKPAWQAISDMDFLIFAGSSSVLEASEPMVRS